jgi:hypothetical protein
MTKPPVAPDDTPRASDGDSMASAEYPNKAVRLAHEPTACKAPIESPSVAPDDTPTRLDEIEKRWQDQADINTDVQFLLAEVSRLREAGENLEAELVAEGLRKQALQDSINGCSQKVAELHGRLNKAEAEVSRLQQENALLRRSLEVLSRDS